MIYEIVRHIEDLVHDYREYHEILGKTPKEIAQGIQGLKEEEIGIVQQNDLQLDDSDLTFIVSCVNNIK